MTKFIEDFHDNTITELINAIDDTDHLELDRQAAFVTGTENHQFLYLTYSFDTDVFDLSENKLNKATIKLEKDTGMVTWYENVNPDTIFVRIAVPPCDINVSEYFSPEGLGTVHIEAIYHEVTNA